MILEWGMAFTRFGPVILVENMFNLIVTAKVNFILFLTFIEMLMFIFKSHLFGFYCEEHIQYCFLQE
ncbi:hypothetical protein LSO9J_130027 [Candidatus Liberibacter solanacearum]